MALDYKLSGAAAILGAAALTMGATGALFMGNELLRQNSTRQAAYAKSEAITPETIREVDKLVLNSRRESSVIIGTLDFALAGYLGCLAYNRSRKASQ